MRVCQFVRMSVCSHFNLRTCGWMSTKLGSLVDKHGSGVTLYKLLNFGADLNLGSLFQFP